MEVSGLWTKLCVSGLSCNPTWIASFLISSFLLTVSYFDVLNTTISTRGKWKKMSHLNDNWLATTWTWVCVIFATIWTSVKWCWSYVFNWLFRSVSKIKKIKRAPVVEDDVRQPDFVRRNIETPHSAVVVGVPRQAKVVPLLDNTRVPCNDHKTAIIKRIYCDCDWLERSQLPPFSACSRYEGHSKSS